MKISEPADPHGTHPVWRLAFRAGFLCAGVFAVLSMLRWLYWTWQPADWDYAIYPAWWHAHEMLFGFAMPVVAGFLLSAVATWTGIAGTRGRPLQVLFALWLAARLILWLLPAYPWLAWLAEMLFLALLAWELTRRVWAVRQWRNMLFPPVLLLLAAACTISYWAMDDAALTRGAHTLAVWMITLLVVIIGGRITPLFTGNKLGFRVPPLPAWFEALAMLSVVLVGLLSLLSPEWRMLPLLYAITGLIHLARLARWRGWKTAQVPLLWSMHLSYLCIPLALFGLAWAHGDAGAEKNMLHLLAVGTIGGMILAMMSRVSLGHTGRPLQVPGYLALAFALVFGAAVVRALLPMIDTELSVRAWQFSGLLWIAAFALFVLRYFPILTRPRADGKPG